MWLYQDIYFIQHAHSLSVLDFCNIIKDALCPLCGTFNFKTTDAWWEWWYIYQWNWKKKELDVKKSRILWIKWTRVDKWFEHRIRSCEYKYFTNECVEILRKIMHQMIPSELLTQKKEENWLTSKPWFNRICKEAMKNIVNLNVNINKIKVLYQNWKWIKCQRI